jgi:large subunit ribosomal protein L25
MSELTLTAQPRDVTGRKVRQLRRQGLVPVVVYGKTQAAISLQVNARALETTLHHGGFSQLVQLRVDGGGMHNVLIRDIQRHPVTNAFTHVDFYAVNMAEKQEVSVQVVGVGTPAALTTGLMVLQQLDAVEISALPADIPAVIEVDISNLDMEAPVSIADLPSLPGIEYLGEPDESVFVLIATRAAEEEEEEVEEEMLAEPEIVGRGKEEEEEED